MKPVKPDEIEKLYIPEMVDKYPDSDYIGSTRYRFGKKEMLVHATVKKISEEEKQRNRDMFVASVLAVQREMKAEKNN